MEAAGRRWRARRRRAGGGKRGAGAVPLEPPEFARARQILLARRAGRPVPDPDQLRGLAEALRGPGSRRLQRRLLALALEQRPDDLGLRHQLALATSKDEELPLGQRQDRALQILEAGDALDATEDQETLALAGATHKRRWERDGQTAHLERALDFYAYAHELHFPDAGYDGYPGVNAAFILDLLAASVHSSRFRSREARQIVADRRDRATAIRRQVIERLEPRLAQRGGRYAPADYWLLVTLAEALFGLGGDAHHREAGLWLERAASVGPEDWQRKTTAQQLARLAHLQDVDPLATPPGAAVQALNALLPETPGWLAGVRIGKVGLALSGGGYRASLFHIGVLARLAELDVLRHVEVLSCVSGGSIVGAAYYLRLRARLEAQPDGTVGRGGYIQLVEELAQEFQRGVERNLRMRLLANPLTLAKSLIRPGYNVTARAGELYERFFYEPVLRSPSRLRLPVRRQRPLMRDLPIRPFGADGGFRPREDNWRRVDKVPILIINAATLNTGHGWQFTPTWMGEPPSALDDDVDRNVRLRRMYYGQAPAPHDRLALGTAVAASAAVPGIFPPLTLRGLYKHTTVRLVDGGAFDNQGIAGLVEQECDVMIVSDASGQMRELDGPPRLRLPVLRRASGILSSQVRRAQWQDLQSRRRGGALRGFMFLHLRAALDGGARDWVRCQEPQENEVEPPPGDAPTPYGVRRDVQSRLARLRTDLDRFSDIEATALMTSGYRMATHELPRCLPSVPVSSETPHAWRFLSDFDEHTATPERAQHMLRVLEIGQQRWLRPLRHAVTRRGAGVSSREDRSAARIA